MNKAPKRHILSTYVDDETLGRWLALLARERRTKSDGLRVLIQQAIAKDRDVPAER